MSLLRQRSPRWRLRGRVYLTQWRISAGIAEVVTPTSNTGHLYLAFWPGFSDKSWLMRGKDFTRRRERVQP